MAQTQRQQKMIYLDGQKSIDLPQYPDEAWNWLTGKPDSQKDSPELYYKAIPTMFRGVRLRALNVARIPFALVDKSGADYDTSDDWQNKVGFLPNPRKLMYLTEASLTLTGRAYQWRKFNAVKTMKLRYLNPFSVSYEVNETTGAITWKRNVGKGPQDVPDGSIVYTWLPDPYVELGAPSSYPGGAALMACGVLGSVDQFVAAFFKRGAIKSTIFTAEGMPQGEKDRFESWWAQFIGGIKNAFATKILNASKMTPVVVGEGLKELENQTLTTEKRKDIALALEIPYSILFSDSARGLGGGGVSEQDDLNFLEDTIIPEGELIAEAWTEQLFEPLGLRMQVRPEGMTAMQEDEGQRAAAFSAYVSALEDPERFLIAADILGTDLDKDIRAKIEALAKAKQEAREQMAEITAQTPKVEPDAQNAPPQNTDDQDDDEAADLKRWQKKALKALERGKSPAVPFESEFIPEQRRGTIAFGLKGCTTPDDVRAVFAGVGTLEDGGFAGPGDAFSRLADELKAAREYLQQTEKTEAQ